MTLRPLNAADLDAIDTLQPDDWPPFRATFERYFTLDCVTPMGLEEGGRLSSMGTLIQFGSSAWVAQLITHPEARGRGLGRIMLDHVLQVGKERGVSTFSLVATEPGYPLYLKAGFRVEGEYAFWTREDAAPPVQHQVASGLTIQPLEGRGWIEMDQQMSGEARQAYFTGKTGDGLLALGRSGLEGYALPQIGEGLVVAKTKEAGSALLHRRLDGARRCVVPAENTQAPEVLTSRGFIEHHRARRMVLGPSLLRRPQWLWSRIGGNLG